jgi:uncharacterized protein YozE (UPF0346 family)
MSKRFWRWVARRLAPHIATDLYRALQPVLLPQQTPDFKIVSDSMHTSSVFSRGTDDIVVAAHPSIGMVK